MIRLYPQVVDREKDIQELREQLASRRDENEDQMMRLTEAAVLIDDLHNQLQTSEKEQGRLVREHSKACRKTAGLRSETDSAVKACSGMSDELANSLQEHEEQLQDLANAEVHCNLRWHELQGSSAQSEHVSAQLRKLSVSLEECRRNVAVSLQARSKLRVDWGEAVQLAAVERGQVSHTTAQIGELRNKAALAESECSKISDQALCSEIAASELWQALAKVEGQDLRRNGLQHSLRSAHENEEELRASIQNGELQDRDLTRAVAESEAQHEDVKTKLSIDKENWLALHDHLAQTEERTATLHGVIEFNRDRHQKLATRRALAEEAGHNRTGEQRKELDCVACECKNLESQAATLKDDTNELQRKVGQTETTKEDLLSSLAKKEEVHEELLVKKAELEAQLEELKKKFRCTVS
eukprot:TRINITY_DN91230_c0_g1_i1.p1 TRINITY_DN91230_c0_g1~~TRINITY_DN91230_c0_g1_i1.p1  ORF type:complete len:413 (-),score=92.44 TRINITY_DN91230_c0_g1_i1:87-1325(-)